jgi:hypothetical protein
MADAEGVTRKRAAVPPMLRCSATVTKAASSARSPPRIGELNSSDRSHPWRLSTSDHGNEAASEGSRCQCQFAAPREQRPDRMMLAWLDIRPSGIPHRETLSPPKISHSSRPGGTVLVPCVVLPHVILLPAAFIKDVTGGRREGSEATYGGRPLISPISRCTACWRHARTRFCNV